MTTTANYVEQLSFKLVLSSMYLPLLRGLEAREQGKLAVILYRKISVN